ncbi:hypothetical protein E2C01_091517 [Portunus trituberculatus]|uniref:Uncharacterized protein n=1 Tax=Portunus trituberculatus TaxID=210409 RepID=A0A5B7JT53_PORTR|nr:hypothetical protein [Portunus trituberculatus]
MIDAHGEVVVVVAVLVVVVVVVVVVEPCLCAAITLPPPAPSLPPGEVALCRCFPAKHSLFFRFLHQFMGLASGDLSPEGN